MKPIVSIQASLNQTSEGKITWEFSVIEKIFGTDETLSQKSTTEFDTEETAALELIQTIKYVLTGEI